eukprot:UN15458
MMRVRLRRAVIFGILVTFYLILASLMFLSSGQSLGNNQVTETPSWKQRRDMVLEYCKSHKLELSKPRQLLQENISPSRKNHYD